MACATLMSVPARLGKNRSGSASRHAARSRHLLRPGAAAGALRAVTVRPPALQLPPTRWPRRPSRPGRTPGRWGSRPRLRGTPGHQARPARRQPPRQARRHMQSTSQGDLADHRRPASYGATFRQPVIIAGAAREEGPGGPGDVEGGALVRSFGCEFLGQCADDRQPRGGWSRRRDGGAPPVRCHGAVCAHDHRLTSALSGGAR
jgi:hypothetical protein